MTKALRQKIVTLVRGEEGVALVVTLALFMFLYISCAGVYTVGKAVKERIILQNAVDAAAYSAAVVQADYLSRIATINKAMAWDYAQLVKAQRNWIRQEFLRQIKTAQGSYRNSTLAILKNAEIGGDKSVNPVSDLIDPLYSEEARLKYGGMDGTGGDVEKYSGRIYEQNDAVAKLRDKMFGEIGETINVVLKANLPYRLGELCYGKVNTNAVLEVLVDEESAFVEISQDPDIGKLNSPSQWFEFNDDRSEGLNRVFTGSLSLGKWIAYNDDITHGKPCGPIDASLISVVYNRAYFQNIAKPLKLIDGFFPADGKASQGAITVAVAKKNENPWLGLVEDLTGFYSAFGHADKNDWTFAIASAQAGYRSGGDDSKGEARQYSLNDDDEKFTASSDNLSETDWDAVFLPVRKAFKDDADFKSELMSDGGWEKLVESPEYIADSLEEIKFYDLNHEALPRMHNNAGANKTLKWDGDGIHDFLDLMFH